LKYKSAMVCAIADFLAPDGPNIHIIWAQLEGPSTQCITLFKTVSQVWGSHFGASKRSAELWKAPTATWFARTST
jgi:hypothetical protein